MLPNLSEIDVSFKSVVGIGCIYYRHPATARKVLYLPVYLSIILLALHATSYYHHQTPEGRVECAQTDVTGWGILL